ncbi:hypothetical protein P3X46_034021, partial [Hevea brasiliensis]
MVEQFEKGLATQEKEVQNPDVLEIIYTLINAPNQEQGCSAFVINERNLAETIADILEKGIKRWIDMALDKINANMEKII